MVYLFYYQAMKLTQRSSRTQPGGMRQNIMQKDDANVKLEKKDTFSGLEEQENDLESINTEALRGLLKKNTKDSATIVVPNNV